MTNKENRLLSAIKNERGSSLVVVIVAFAVLIITGTALAGIVFFNHKNAMDYHKKQQAEYTARGAMQAIERAFINPSVGGGQAMIDAVVAAGATGITGTGDISSADMGKYNVSLKLISEDIIHAEVIATYRSISYKLSAYFKKDEKGNRLNPHDFIFFSKDKWIDFQSTSANKTMITGNIYTNNAIYTDTSIKGKLLNFGSTEFGSNSDLDGTLIAIASTTVRMGSSITGEIYHNGTLGFDDAATGDKTTKKEKIDNVNKIGISDAIKTDHKKWRPIQYQYHSPSANFTLGGIKFLYPLYKPESLPSDAVQSGNTITLANGDVINMQTKLYTSAGGDTLNYTNPANPTFTLAPRTKTTNFFSDLSVGRYDVTSGNISNPITFDTSGGDIHLYCSSNVNVNATTKIIGDNNVYFHLEGNTMTVSDGVALGENDQTNHQLFIEGDDATLDLKGTAKFKGAAYLDNGTYKETGNLATSGEKVLGSITASTINITRGNTYTYCDFFKKPDFDATLVKPNDNTPADEGYFIYPPLATGASAWTLLNYAK